MATHPADINGHLAHAFSGIGRLIEDAKKRGDAAGADAWQVALVAVEVAEREMVRAREKQDWRRPRVLEQPPIEVVKAALQAARLSECQKSKRGAVVFRRSDGAILGRGNNMPMGACDGSDACRRDCSKRCVHAEGRVLRNIPLEGERKDWDLVHVKLGPLPVGPVVTNLPMVTVAAAGGPSCWQCSREILDAGLAGVWLFESVPTATSGEWADTTVGEWRYYTAKDFHDITLSACGIYPYAPIPEKASSPCKQCGDTGVIETGNDDLPCDCPAGDRAVFNSDRGRETGAQLKARRR